MAGATDPWHLDKRVPIALIAALILQTGGLVWWAASLAGQVEGHERRIVHIEAGAAKTAQESQRLSETLARLDERMIAQTAILRRIEENLARRPAP